MAKKWAIESVIKSEAHEISAPVWFTLSKPSDDSKEGTASPGWTSNENLATTFPDEEQAKVLLSYTVSGLFPKVEAVITEIKPKQRKAIS